MANFINPYTFVPLAKEPPKRGTGQEEVSEKLYTGKIRYRIETLSPLFIPNTSYDKVFKTGDGDEESADHKSYDFFSYHELNEDTDPNVCYEPVIPGSELRGMVRSVYEAVTNSCLSAVDENETLSKRTPDYFKPGVLEKSGDGYVLYEAKDYLYRANGGTDFSVHSYEAAELSMDGIDDGGRVYFDARTRSGHAKPFAYNIASEKGQRRFEGYLLKGEPGPVMQPKDGYGKNCSKNCPKVTREKCQLNEGKNCYFYEKHCAHVFVIDKNKKAYERALRGKEAENVRRRMDQLLDIYAKNRDGKMYEEYSNTWKEFKKTNSRMRGIAVYYSIADGICYLSPACITREVYKKTLGEILGAHKACSEALQICPACRLFGAVNSKLQKASKIRFSDAYVAEKKEANSEYYDKRITLLELSTPKLSSTEFYLQRPEDERVMSWTYDYYVALESDGKPVVKAYGKDMPQISGRKFYWHSPETAEWLRGLQGVKVTREKKLQDLIPKNERNKTVRPLKKGIAFQGELFFDGITKQQLDELIRILNISELEEKGKYALKLGSAKPLGFGSVAVQVEQVVFRTVSWDEDSKLVYKADNPYDFTAVKLTPEIRASGILTILDMKALENLKDSKVHYPRIDKEPEKNAEEGFVWFMNNRVGMKDNVAPRSREQVVYLEYMQPLSPELKSNEKVKNLIKINSKGSNGGGKSYKGGQPFKGSQSSKGGQSFKDSQSMKASQPLGSSLGTSLSELMSNKTYEARILTQGKVQNGDKKYLVYKIDILGNNEFHGKECTLSAPSNRKLSISDTVDVIQHKSKGKDRTFRLSENIREKNL